MFLGEEEHLVVEEIPVAGVLGDGDDGDQEARCRGKVGGLVQRVSVYLDGGGKEQIIPVVSASPMPTAYRWHPGHRSADFHVRI